MPEQSCFKQVDEKHVSAKVKHMIWSPKMDLISLANEQGEVILYRLSWQKVWSLPPPAEGVTVSALAWRPDGKVVAVGYTSGKLILCDVENSDVLHSTVIQGQITHMSWISHNLPEDGEAWSSKPYPEDTSETFLPKLQPLNKSYGTLAKEHRYVPSFC
ncbi:anaphase-promoting complex subunit 4-like [Liolophura sinensis]|uniref:anaphase-promoting complex subunit 4-like n=1 Tax=Liolophura sinensis TaxID=3198878 RepID=UPI003158B696